jgi:uncharacterized membrane protein YbaN (DUF454 family)
VHDQVVRWLWLAAGFAALAAGVIGIVLPLLPTVPFVILAAYCFSKGSRRWERWMLEHPRLGPIVRDWRENHAVPLRAKQLAIVMMAISCTGTWLLVPMQVDWLGMDFRVAWIPTVLCTAAAVWLWRLPTRKKKT